VQIQKQAVGCSEPSQFKTFLCFPSLSGLESPASNLGLHMR